MGDSQPGSFESRMRMVEVSLDSGTWFYRILYDKAVCLRSRCSTSDSCKLRLVPEKGAVVRVGQRTKIGSTTFLRLKDGSGWMFDHKDGKMLVEGPLDVHAMRQAPATVIAEDGVPLLKSPTNEKWARTNMVVLHNAKVQVSVKAIVEGILWMEVSKPGGMQGWVPAETLMLDLDVSSNAARYR